MLRIAMVCTVGIPVSPGILTKQSLGGSETAFISMAQSLAKIGHSVTCFAETGGKEYLENGVNFQPIQKYVQDDSEYHVAVFSRDCTILNLKKIKAMHTVLWLHDMPAPDSYARSQMATIWGINEVFYLSDYHSKIWNRSFDILENNSWKTRNGLDLELIQKARAENAPSGSKKSLMFTSRPERGLLPFLAHIWPRILSEISPDIELKLCSYSTPDNLVNDQAKAMHQQIGKLINSSQNIRVLGYLNKAELYKELSRSNALVYPTDFPEISCIAVAEAAACGVPVITSKMYALPETLGKNYPGLVEGNPVKRNEYVDDFIATLKKALLNPEPFIYAGLEATRDKSWDLIATEWDNHFYSKLHFRDDIKYSEPTLAACMIVKNEEDDIHGCLNSFAEYVDEIHITDTGSTDKTLERIESWRLDHPKCNLYLHHRDGLGDFDDARNQSISYTNCDWIFWIDADERLTGGTELRKYLSTTMFNGIIVEQCHFYLDMENSSDTPVRIFRNIPLSLPFVKEPFKRIAFVGAIHEHPMQDDVNYPVHPVVIHSGLKLAHMGYFTEDIRRAKVRDRNLELLMRDRVKWPNRNNGLVLAMRDLLHMFGWAYEKGTVNPIYLFKVVSMYDTSFKQYANGKAPWYMSQLYDHAFANYQKALALAAKHRITFANKYVPFSAKIHVSIASGEEAPTPQRGSCNWYLTPEEYKAEMSTFADIAIAKLQGGESYDF